MIMDDIAIKSRNLSNVLCAFISLVRNGLILLIEKRPCEFSKEIVASMAPMARLVVNLSTKTPPFEGESILESDLRVAVHRQKPEKFLKDISQHKFDLIVCDQQASAEIVERVSVMILPGGCFLALPAKGATSTALNRFGDDFYPLEVDGCRLYVKRGEKPGNTRRGGRSGRISN